MTDVWEDINNKDLGASVRAKLNAMGRVVYATYPDLITTDILNGALTGKLNKTLDNIDATSDELPEGALNLFFTDARADARVQEAASTALPLINGVPTEGIGEYWAREDHVHPTDTTRADTVLSNLSNRFTARSNIGLPGSYSLGDIPESMSASDATDLVETWLQDCADNGLILFVPSKHSFQYSRKMLVNAHGAYLPSIVGESAMSLIPSVSGGINDAAIEINISGQKKEFCWFNVGFFNDDATLDNEHSCGIHLTGGDDYVEHGYVDNIYSIGCYATIINDLATFASGFGNENWLNNTTFNHLGSFYHPSSVVPITAPYGNAKYVYWARNGSGTGNQLLDFRGNFGRQGTISDWDDIEAYPAYSCFGGGAGVVIQDIIAQCHATCNQSAIVSVDPAALVANIQGTGQVDAGAVKFLRFAGGAPTSPVYGIRWTGIVGGGIDLSADDPAYYGSVWIHQGVSKSETGVILQGLAAGAPYRVQIGSVSVQSFDASLAIVQASGIVQGVGAAVHTAFIQLTTDGAAVTPKLIFSSTNPSPASSNDIQLSYEVIGRVIYFYAEYTSGSTGNRIDGQMRVMGGGHLAKVGVVGATPTVGTTLIDRNADQWSSVKAYTPTLTFASGAVTYSVQSGLHVQNGKRHKLFAYIALASLGTATGAASISGFPATISSDPSMYGAKAEIDLISGFNTITGGVLGRPAVGGTSADLKMDYGASAIGAGNFSATAILAYSIEYLEP